MEMKIVMNIMKKKLKIMMNVKKSRT